VSWIPYLKVEEVLIVDDEYAKDEFMTALIREASPEGISVKVLTIDKSAEYLKRDDNGVKILILSRFIESIDKLINLNIEIKKVNIGGLGFCEGRKKHVNAIHMSEQELDILNKIAKKGIAVEIQMLPKDKAIILGN